MQSKVNQEENLEKLLRFLIFFLFSALSDSVNYMELLCKVKSSVSW